MLRRLMAKLRRYLVTGLVVVAPLGVTAWVLQWLFRRLDSILGQYIVAAGLEPFPGIGLLVLVVLLIFVGWMLRWAVGRKLVGWWNSLLSRLPLTRTIYNASSQIAQTVLARKEKLFQRCALIEYPSPGSYSLAFVTARSPDEIEVEMGTQAITVFLPTAPNPASGYLLMLPAERVRMLDMSVEDGLKLVLSAGAVAPGNETRHITGLDLDRLMREAGVPDPPRREGRRRWTPGGERSQADGRTADEHPPQGGSAGPRPGDGEDRPEGRHPPAEGAEGEKGDNGEKGEGEA